MKSSILIVDDSVADRDLAARFLRQFEDVIIEFADSGEAAIDRIADEPPIVILTDMIMPGMSGLELLASVHESHPEIPVVLTTGQGSEQIAADALQHGAMGYVPKSLFKERLVETIRQVMAVSAESASRRQLMACLEKVQIRFRLRNDLLLISPLIEMVQQLVFDAGVCDRNERGRLGVALDEALINAMYHGNLELPVELLQAVREQIHAEMDADIIDERASEPPHADRRVDFEATITPDEARFVICDEGRGFDTSRICESSPVLENEGGRGLTLIRTFMDDVSFNESGNALTLVKKRN